VKKEWEFDMNLNELKLFCSKRGNRHFVVVQKKTCFREAEMLQYWGKLKIERICKKYCNTMIHK
jgi:hypothetical protein